MQSCIKILHFLLNGGPCLTKTKQSDQLDEYQQVKMVKMAKFIKTGKENSSSLSMLYFQSLIGLCILILQLTFGKYTRF